jgi:hypothetical protein
MTDHLVLSVQLKGEMLTEDDAPGLASVRVTFGPIPEDVAEGLLDHLRDVIPAFVKQHASAMTPVSKDGAPIQ